MTKIIFVRHGEPDYLKVSQRKFIGHGRDLADLTEIGKEQARIASNNKLLDGAEIIISSPYTRALQTAAIISKARQLDLEIEIDIHEWLPDLTYTFDSDEKAINASLGCEQHKGMCPEHIVKKWETLEHLFKRANNSLKRYLGYKKVIVVSHGMLIKQFIKGKDIPYCGVFEVDFHEDYEWHGYIDKNL